MTDLNLGVTGAKRTSYNDYNLRTLFLKVHAENPHADKMQLRDLLVTEIWKASPDVERHGDGAYIAVAVEYAATCTVNNSFRPPPETVEEELRAKRKAAEQKQAAAAQVSSKAEAEVTKHIRREAIKLLDLLMPHGKVLRDCTGTDCRKFGGWLNKVADKVGRKKVGAVLSEAQIRKLRKA